MADRTFNDVKINITLKPQAERANVSSSQEDLAVQMGKIQQWYPGLNNYATCATAAATAIKTVDCPGFELTTGTVVIVKFTVTNTAAVADLQLNVNETGAKHIKYRNSNLSAASVLTANRIYAMLYDGTYWQIIGDLDTNSNTYDRTSVSTRIYAGAKGVFPYSLCAMDTVQRMQSFTTTGGTGTSKAFNSSEKFMYPPVIMYHSSSLTIENGSVIANNALYEQYPAVNMQYNANVTETSAYSQYKPLYIECAFDSNGYWSPTGITQTFTSGKYYILLGCMYNTSIYQLALFAQHPLYYYDGTNLIDGESHLQDGRYIPMTGSYGISGNLGFNGTNHGYYLKDSTGLAFPGIYYNSTDFWIGATQQTTTHFTGRTMISTGYNSESGKGNTSIWVYIPNSTNTGSYGYEVFNSTNLVTGAGITISTANHQLFNGAVYTIKHSNSVTARTDYMQPYVKYDAQGHITGSSYWMADAKGTDGTAGWIKVATIKHKMTYDNTPFLLDVSQRGNTISYRIHIRWNNDNGVDPSLGEFLIASDHAWESIRPRAYIIKSATSTWDLYILKIDNYEAIAMRLQPGRYFNDHTEWTWKDEQTAESAITGGTEATKKIYSTTDHTHDLLISKTLTAETLDGTAGNFFFKGNLLLGGINDWVGIQADSGADKFQLIANSNNLLFRQNDTGGTNSTNWQTWNYLMTPECVTGENGITATIREGAVGSGDSATPFNLGVKIGHSNSVTAVTTASLLKFKYDAQGHITGSSAVVKGDIPTLDYVPFKTVTGTPDMNDYMNEDGWIKWNTSAGTNVPTGNWGILLTKALPNIQVFIPDNATGIYFRRKANATSNPTEWWGLTGSAGNTYNLNNFVTANNHVLQSNSATENYRPILMGYTSNASADQLSATVTNQAYVNTRLYTQPSTGRLYSIGGYVVTTSGAGLHLTDSTNSLYSGIVDNGSNLWIGATHSTSRHHVGQTVISSGYNGTTGNPTILVSVPNDTNNGCKNYPVIHTGNMNDEIPSTKYAFIVDETSDFASYAWHKFAEVTVTGNRADATITFLVSKTWTYGNGNPSRQAGILNAHIRTSATNVFETGEFRWIVAGDYIDPTEFVMVYIDTASTSCKVELWHKQKSRWDGWVFKVLKEHSRLAYGENPWTLFVHTGHGSETYTTGTGNIVSTIITIANTSASADKINTDAGDFQRPVYFSNGVPVAVNIATPGAYFGVVPQVRKSDGVMEIGRYIDFHATDDSTNDYDMRIQAASINTLVVSSKSSADGGSTYLKIAGTLPMLRFQQTTSGKEYDSSTCGIWCKASSTAGVNMYMQSGGNIMIGAGEFAYNAYSRKDSTGTTQVGYDNIAESTEEKLYLGADNEVQIISNGQNIATYSNTSHKVWRFQTNGQLITPNAITDTLASQHIMIHQNVRSESNAVTLVQWLVDGAASANYNPGISFHNTGGDATNPGAIILRPYHHDADAWATGHPVGLYIGKNILSLDGVNVALQNAASLNTMINSLSTASSTPVDADYYVAQWANGGTTTTTYHRRPVSALWKYMKGKHIKDAVAVQTGSSKKTKITLQTLMTWLITTKAYIPSNTTDFVMIKTTWSWGNNDILQFTANGVQYEMSLAGVIMEFKGKATAYNAGEFTFSITSAPAVLADTTTSGYTRFPPNTTAIYHCNGSSYTPIWTVNMNKAVQQLLYSSTSSAGFGYADITIGNVFGTWTVLLLEFMEASYGYSKDYPHSGSGLIPLSLVRSIGNVSDVNQQYQIPIGYNPGNTTADQYISVVYTDDSTFRLSRGGAGGPIGKLKIYGIC